MQGHHSTGGSVFPVVVGRLGRHWAPSAFLQHHLQPKEQWHIPLAPSSPASQTQELHAKAVLLGAHAGLLQDTVLGWGHPGHPEVSQMCCPTCSQLGPRAVPAGSGLTHISWDGCSVANGDALLSAGCKQELFFPARGQGSPAPCSKVLHGMQLSPSHCGPGSTDILPAALCSSHHLVTASAWLGALQTPGPV